MYNRHDLKAGWFIEFIIVHPSLHIKVCARLHAKYVKLTYWRETNWFGYLLMSHRPGINASKELNFHGKNHNFHGLATPSKTGLNSNEPIRTTGTFTYKLEVEASAEIGMLWALSGIFVLTHLSTEARKETGGVFESSSASCRFPLSSFPFLILSSSSVSLISFSGPVSYLSQVWKI